MFVQSLYIFSGFSGRALYIYNVDLPLFNVNTVVTSDNLEVACEATNYNTSQLLYNAAV